mmetsp:Transcript_71687/g.171216  ORF Transcript_71687/g.171216 Transcript_71687/m.171216 type:complete len:310 (+) Transcript_71687:95-1024(+)
MGARRHTGQLLLFSSHLRKHASWYMWPRGPAAATSAASPSWPVKSSEDESSPAQIRTTQPFSSSASTPSEQIGQSQDGSSLATLSTLTSRRSSASHQATRTPSKPDSMSTSCASSKLISKRAYTVRPAALSKSAIKALCGLGLVIASKACPGCNRCRCEWQSAHKSKSRQCKQRYRTPEKSRSWQPSQITPKCAVPAADREPMGPWYRRRRELLRRFDRRLCANASDAGIVGRGRAADRSMALGPGPVLAAGSGSGRGGGKPSHADGGGGGTGTWLASGSSASRQELRQSGHCNSRSACTMADTSRSQP